MRRKGQQYRLLEIVPSISEADVVLAWYETSIQERPISGRDCCSNRSYSYLILRTPTEFEILRRIIIEGFATAREHIGDTLRSEFFKKLKARKISH